MTAKEYDKWQEELHKNDGLVSECEKCSTCRYLGFGYTCNKRDAGIAFIYEGELKHSTGITDSRDCDKYKKDWFCVLFKYLDNTLSVKI